MTIRTVSLGSAALAGLLFAAAPAFAEDNYSNVSTPAERVQTNALNSDAADRAHSNGVVSTAAQDDYDAARVAYERSLNNYDARKAAYDNDRARYEGERYYYDSYRTERWNAFHDRDRYRDVLGFRSADLIGMTVSTRNGERIGRIRDAEYNSRGQVNRIAVEVRNNRVAWVYADDVRYDPQLRVILIDLSSDQVDILVRMNHPGA
jgi:sporulation protein YlmC with PRC-barrel domain